MDSGLLGMLREGGPFAYVGLLCGVLSLMGALGAAGVLVASLVRRINRGPMLGCGGALMALTLVLVSIGALGYWMGITEMEAALAFADPDSREALEARGREIAGYPLTLTGIMAIFPGLVALAVIIRGLMPPKEEAAG